MLSRRAFLGSVTAAAASTLLWPVSAAAIGPSSLFTIAQLDDGSGQAREGSALQKLLLEVEKRTSITVASDAVSVRADSDALFEQPMLFWSGDAAFDPLPDDAITRLSLFVRAGGFIVVDDRSGSRDSAFGQRVREELARVLPAASWEPVARDHVVFKSFYLLDQPWGRLDLDPTLQALLIDDHLAVVSTNNDLQGAWARDAFGSPLFDVEPGGEQQRELAFRFGINLVMYALCTTYKEDQVHVPFILKRRQWRSD